MGAEQPSRDGEDKTALNVVRKRIAYPAQVLRAVQSVLHPATNSPPRFHKHLRSLRQKLTNRRSSLVDQETKIKTRAANARGHGSHSVPQEQLFTGADC